MTDVQRRLARLEAQMNRQADRLVWADVHAAEARQRARVCLALGKRLGVDASDPRMVDARMWLTGDDPAQVAQDAELVARWSRQQGIPADTGEVRQRVTERLEVMARRLVSAPHKGIP
jgi:hypothetical protein